MPGVIRAAVSVGTLPFSLASKFSESRAVQMNMNEYHDGSCQRVSLVTGSRRTWKLSKRLDAFHLGLLRTFCNTVQGGAFNFYNPFETLPAFTKNPIGTAGLYLVRFNSDWSQINGMGRSECDLEIIEVSATGAIDIGAPIIPDAGPGGPGGGGPGGGGPATTPSVPIDPINIAEPEGYYRNYGPISYGGALWAFTLTENSLGAVSDFRVGIYKSTDSVNWIRQDLANATFQSQPSYSYWDGVSSIVTLLVFQQTTTAPSNQTQTLFVDFDMSTGLFGSSYGLTNFFVIPSGAYGDGLEANVFLDQAYLFKLSNGTMRAVYGYYYGQSGGTEGPPISQSQVYYRDYSPGTGWADRQVFPMQTVEWSVYYSLTSAVQDGDVVHAVYMPVANRSNNGPISGTEQYYVRINADGTFSTPVALSSILMTGGATGFSLNTGIVSGGNLLVPVLKEFGFGLPRMHGVLIGTPTSDPGFTFVQIGSTSTNLWGMFMASHMSAQDVFAFVMQNPDTGNGSRIFISKSFDHGTTWSDPVLALDIDAVPGPPVDHAYYFGSPDQLDIKSLSLGANLNGSIGLIYTTLAAYYASLSS